MQVEKSLEDSAWRWNSKTALVFGPRRLTEEVLYSRPGVAEAGVVGVPDKILGSAIKAVIVPQKGIELSGKDVLRHCASRLEDFMQPKFMEFRDQMPKTSTGKIAKREMVR